MRVLAILLCALLSSAALASPVYSGAHALSSHGHIVLSTATMGGGGHPTIVQASAVLSAGAQATISGSLTGVVAGDAIIALVNYADTSNNSSYPSGVSDGNAYTEDKEASANHFSSIAYSYFNAASGSHTVVATKAASATASGVYWTMQLFEVAGVPTTDSYDSASGGSSGDSTGPVATTTATLANANDLVFFVCNAEPVGASLTYPSGWVGQGIYASYPTAVFASLLPGSTTALSPAAGTLSSMNNWAAVAAAYQP